MFDLRSGMYKIRNLPGMHRSFDQTASSPRCKEWWRPYNPDTDRSSGLQYQFDLRLRIQPRICI